MKNINVSLILKIIVFFTLIIFSLIGVYHVVEKSIENKYVCCFVGNWDRIAQYWCPQIIEAEDINSARYEYTHKYNRDIMQIPAINDIILITVKIPSDKINDESYIKHVLFQEYRWAARLSWTEDE